MEETTEMEGVRHPSPMSIQVAISTSTSRIRCRVRLFCKALVTYSQSTTVNSLREKCHASMRQVYRESDLYHFVV